MKLGPQVSQMKEPKEDWIKLIKKWNKRNKDIQLNKQEDKKNDKF